MKQILIVITIFLIMLVDILLMSGCSTLSYLTNPNSKLAYFSIKELSQNPSAFEGQNITISGKLNQRLGGYSMEDSEGYWVWIDNNCIESQRQYQYNSQTYGAKGTWLPPKKDQFFGVGDQYRLGCIVPLI